MGNCLQNFSVLSDSCLRLAGVSSPARVPRDRAFYDRAEKLFKESDKDNVGSLSKRDIFSILLNLGMKPSSKEINVAFERYKCESDGMSFDDFCDFLESQAVKSVELAFRTTGKAADGGFLDSEFPPTKESIGEEAIVKCCGGKIPAWQRAVQLKHAPPRRPNGRILVDVSPNDVYQGKVADCWLMSCLSALAEFPGVVTQVFETKVRPDDGKWTLRFYNNEKKTWTQIVIDDFIPIGENGKPLFCHPKKNFKQLWPLLIEKAFAKWCGGYEKLAWGLSAYAFTVLTDAEEVWQLEKTENSETFNSSLVTWSVWERFNITYEDCKDPRSASRTIPHHLPLREKEPNKDQLWVLLQKWDTANYIMSCYSFKQASTTGSQGMNSEDVGTDGIVRAHAYTVISAIEEDGHRLLLLRNPWGKFEWQGSFSDSWSGWDDDDHKELKKKLNVQVRNDGVFWMSFDDFHDIFSLIDVLPKTMKFLSRSKSQALSSGS